MLVVADAGFGKTGALEQALERGELNAAWMWCGDVGGDAGRLVGRVVDAVRAAVPGAVDVLAERLAARASRWTRSGGRGRSSAT